MPQPRNPARRFLAAGARGGNGHGYLSTPQRELPLLADEKDVLDRIATATSMSDEPESLDAQDWKAHIDERHKTIEQQRRKFEAARIDQERRLLTFEQRLVKTQAEARRQHIDVSGEVRQLRHMQAKAKDVRHLETRLGTMERKVYRDVDLNQAA